MSGDPQKLLDEYKEKVKNSFSTLIEKTFPEKILQLNELLESEKFSLKRINAIHTPVDVEPLTASGGSSRGGTSSEATSAVDKLTHKFMEFHMLHKLLPPGGVVECNIQIKELVDLVQHLHFELLQNTAAVKNAINFFVPKVEDGNNFGVEIQEEVLKIIKEKERDLELSGFTSYYKDRASIATDICREPHVDDYREALRLIDQRAFLFLVNVVTSLRDVYIQIHDIITKNMEKIKKPRTSNADSLSN